MLIFSRVEVVLNQISSGAVSIDMKRLHTVIHRKILDTLDRVSNRSALESDLS